MTTMTIKIEKDLTTGKITYYLWTEGLKSRWVNCDESYYNDCINNCQSNNKVVDDSFRSKKLNVDVYQFEMIDDDEEDLI